MQFTEEQLGKFYAVLDEHGIFLGPDNYVNGERARELFTSLLKTMLKSMDQKQHTQIQRIL